MATGKLLIVGTPIGNLEDITLRALRALREADCVAAEDTRHTGMLLTRYEIRKPLVSYHEFSEAKRTPELLAKLRAGQSVALVSDAGMPTISDPGFRLIRAAIADGVPVEVVPGVSAVTAALAIAGLTAVPFLFHGFLPHKSGQRRRELERLKSIAGTLVFYESPYRVEKLVVELNDLFAGRQVVLARELTKKFEEYLRGTPAELLEVLKRRSLKGEFVVLVAGEASG